MSELTLKERRKEAISKLAHYRGEVQSKNTIRQLPDVEVGQIFWVDMDGKAYIVSEKDNRKLTIKALDEMATISTGMTIFEMNKNIVSKEPIMDWDDEEMVKALIERMQEWFAEDEVKDKEYFLLYGRNIHYVSLFKITNKGNADIPVILDTCKAIGDVVSFDFNTEEGAKCIEVWVRTAESKAELLYMFPYDSGLVLI